ncbi:lipase family alpha/beta hydrolase [Actinomadura rayongensis]|uniref:Alpha/beta fold hydrolase n=1 Tax=Actinomadura rayongensis TaxID=1429076 RepID=A0A6I4VVX5_9ACTN|nr:alpha/beta fold hydrolase [Actinomadura rayongensis]MXQ62459.1 alpha/beta fold hydrolase [Actinomadura rayongensis]
MFGSARRIWRRAVFAPAVAAVAALSLPAAAQADTALPVKYSSLDALPGVFSSAPPPGANDFSCKPSAAHPRPVVLVEGTSATMALNFNAISPLLKNNGYCVFALNYGKYGALTAVGDIPTSAGELATFVDKVLAATGADKVDLVGHSQGGGITPRYYLKFNGGAAKVASLVGLAPSNHGASVSGFADLLKIFPFLQVPLDALGGPAWAQQAPGSAVLTKLNAGGDTMPGVKYTVIASRYDEVVTPYESAFLTGPDVTNITVQDVCDQDYTEHLAIAFDHVALRLMLNALDPAHQAKPTCSQVLPLIGG